MKNEKSDRYTGREEKEMTRKEKKRKVKYEIAKRSIASVYWTLLTSLHMIHGKTVSLIPKRQYDASKKKNHNEDKIWTKIRLLK